MPVIESGNVRIHYRDFGEGFPLFLIPGGGLNSTLEFFNTHAGFNPFAELGQTHRCIAADLRNARGGLSVGPFEIDRPWDAFTDDHLRVMDHLGIERCFVLGFCIGGPLIWNLIRRAPDRVVAAVLVDPSGVDPACPDFFYDFYRRGWASEFRGRHPQIATGEIEIFLTHLYRTKPDFMFTVTRDFAKTCPTPLLVLPDDIAPHPFVTAM